MSPAAKKINAFMEVHGGVVLTVLAVMGFLGGWVLTSWLHEEMSTITSILGLAVGLGGMGYISSAWEAKRLREGGWAVLVFLLSCASIAVFGIALLR